MANQNISRLEGRHKKRDISVFFAEINYDEIATSGDVYQLAQLPPECVVLSVTYLPIVTNNAGTSLVADIGIGGDATLIAAANLKSAAGTAVASTLVPLHLPTGGTLTLKPTYGGAAATAGKGYLYVEYLEYRQCTGELTNFVE